MKKILLSSLPSFGFILVLVMLSIQVSAQQGKLTGKVVDGETGEELVGATIVIIGTTKGALTDIFGNYEIFVDPGKYTFECSYISYEGLKTDSIQINSGIDTKFDFKLNPEILGEVQVFGEAIKDNDIALLETRKKSLNLEDAISVSEMKSLGASSVAESMKQITGASVVGGKYVVIRGLGDRYSITQMNGVTLPSVDPYKNSATVDLIPTDMVDNIITLKTFTPDQPGNFTGGKVDVATKTIPDEFYLNFGISTSYNPFSNLNDAFLKDGVDNGNILGLDDGIRSRPEVLDTYGDEISKGGANTLAILGRQETFSEERDIIDQTAKSLNNPFSALQETSSLNSGMKISFGNQYRLFGNHKLGINFGLNYDNKFSQYDEGRIGNYSDGGGESLITQRDFDWINSSKDIQVGSLTGIIYKFNNSHRLSFTNLIYSEASTNIEESRGFWLESGGFDEYVEGIIHHVERNQINSQLSGGHTISQLKFLKVDWSTGIITGKQDEPDYRAYGYFVNELSNGDIAYLMQKSQLRLPFHIYRDLVDNQVNFQADFTLPITDNDENLLKVGFSHSKKERDFNEFQYSLVQPGVNDDYQTLNDLDGDLDAYLSEENSGQIGIDDNDRYTFGNFYSNQSTLENSYEGTEIISAGYMMGAYNIHPKIKVVVGCRLETTNMSSISKDTSLITITDILGNQTFESRNGVIDRADFLPALNLKYKSGKKSNVRIAFSQTLARPNMREISPFKSIDGISGGFILGDKNLKRTLIINLDGRYELFPKEGEIFSVSAYYKNFKDPIIWFLSTNTSTLERRPINVARAEVYGIELEFKKPLGFISPALANTKFATNSTLIYSQSDKDPSELEALSNAERPNIKDWRPFQGQSPYIINFSLIQNTERLKWESSISFNVFGRRLIYVTGALDPDVYERSRVTLNYTTSKALGDHFSLGFKVKNILNNTNIKEYDFEGGDFFFESYKVGRTFSVSLSYKI